ncbi:YqeG family HAD IIIA-type phosphatase [Fimbriimonas ginsengisoli]|uniref:HAD superfamily (Subfamily IIIA) phosphatase, TIGR01668 n=1 Tax=Fimbriimonas ginsengisoli Gsoil 348 TaxID=661478 RepID=A0A068NLS0_FIMGI|nr:YqeG family HAD IIIA-type phosphatase [Fimbriimonas ginsengisoli]AIE84421.1 HAD superfamily (subfamily IIIA) phosphatase, TIGR01668 [Fimbriimonas ginsengisoli Gsoil 348]
MSRWQSGDFDRERISDFFHPFTPAHAADSLEQVDLQRLWDRGKRLILLDVDNTLVEWKGENFAPAVVEWLEKAKGMGFTLCILSNTRRVERLMRITQLLGVETVRGRFKPSRAMYRLALIKFHKKPEEAIMIGDQMMTDILGANRAGIDAIWVRKMASKEFGPTRINRFIEGLLTGPIYKSLITPLDEHGNAAEVTKPLRERSVYHQFVKFAIVGATSFAVDLAIKFFLIRYVHAGNQLLSEQVGHTLRTDFPGLFSFARDDQGAAAPILGFIASLFAMFNSFVWNRLWTFEVRGKEERLKQMKRFYAVSLVGLVINNVVFTLFFNIIPGHRGVSLAVANALGAVVAAAWNFYGSRRYAFKQ